MPIENPKPDRESAAGSTMGEMAWWPRAKQADLRRSKAGPLLDAGHTVGAFASTAALVAGLALVGVASALLGAFRRDRTPGA